MSLTSQDLNNIRTIVKTEVKSEVSGLATKSELRHATSGLVTKSDLIEGLDRMESRLTTAIGLLQRDSYSRLDDHDARIARLEKAVGG